jgi:hypothetical protein
LIFQVSFAIRRANATMWPDQMTIHKSAGSSAGFPGARLNSTAM